MIAAGFSLGQLLLAVDINYRGFTLGKPLLPYKSQKRTTELEGSSTKSKKKNENTKNPALNPSFELDKRTRSGQPAKTSELKLGCYLCGFPYYTFDIPYFTFWSLAYGVGE